MRNKGKIAQYVLKDDFGDVIAKIGGELMLRGRLTVEQIMQYTELPYLQVRNALLVMIQHHFVQFVTDKEIKRELERAKQAQKENDPHAKKSKQETQMEEVQASIKQAKERTTRETGAEEEEEEIYFYEILLDNIVARMRFSKYILDCKQRFGVEGESIMEELLKHGRLPPSDIIQFAFQSFVDKKRKEETPEYLQEELGENLKRSVQGRIERGLQLMVRNKFIIRVPEIGTSTAKPDSKKITLKEKIRSEETKAKKRDQESKKSKKRKRKADEPDNSEEEPSNKQKKKKVKKASTVTQKAAEEMHEEITFDVEEDLMPTQAVDLGDTAELINDKVLYRVNYDQFYKNVRNDLIVQYVSQKLNATSAAVVRALLDSSTTFEPIKYPETSFYFAFDEIMKRANDSGEISISGQQMKKILDLLCKDSVGIMVRGSNSVKGESFAIALANLCGIIKRAYAENIIEQKFGSIGARIFRMLLAKKQLEQKQIADFALVSMQEARSVLYKMLQEGILQLQEVPKSLDHNPLRTFYLWNVNIEKNYEKITDDMYKTISNLRNRFVREQTEMLEKVGGNLNSDNMSEEQKLLVTRLGLKEDRIESSLVKLQELLFIFD